MRRRYAPALVLVAAVACSHSSPPPSGPAAGETFTLRPGESAKIGETPFRITFERILSDSRCAVDVVCIQAGEAAASFRADAGPGRSDSFVLDTGGKTTAAVWGYEVSLVSVSPAPRSTVRIEPRSYVVSLTVSPEKGSSPPS